MDVTFVCCLRRYLIFFIFPNVFVDLLETLDSVLLTFKVFEIQGSISDQTFKIFSLSSLLVWMLVMSF